MTTSINLHPDVYEILRRSYGETMLREKATDILLQGVISTLERYNREILTFEEKYGCGFQEFEQQWDSNAIPDKYGYAVESDFIDWEMLEGEKRLLLGLVAQVRRGGKV
jgi:hypothetical protein